MADTFKIFYRYCNESKDNETESTYGSIKEVLDALTSPYNYNDRKGEKYFVGVKKSNEVWYSLSTVNDLIERINRYLGNESQCINLQPLQDNTTMAAKTGFEYTVILHGIPVKDNSGNDVTPDSEIIIKPTTVVAVDSNHVTRIASRKIITTISDSDLGRVEIKVRNL